jgi:L-2-hydroxyglutarate oxidase LhgO
MEKLFERGVKNGVEGLEIIDQNKILKKEPHLTKAISGIWSPNTGITNYEAVSNSFAKDIEKMGGSVKLNYEVSKLEKYGVNKISESGISVHGKGVSQPVNVQYLIACAGLYSDRLAVQTGNSHSPAVIPFRGEWFKLKPEKCNLVNGLIYPVPDPAFPWLGVHFTIKTNGEVW